MYMSVYVYVNMFVWPYLRNFTGAQKCLDTGQLKGALQHIGYAGRQTCK